MAEAEAKVESVKKVSRAIQSFQRALEQNYPKGAPPNKEYFDSLMASDSNQMKKEKIEMTEAHTKQTYDPTIKPSPIEQVSNQSNKIRRVENYSSRDLIAETKDAITQIDTLKEKLASPELRIKSSVQHLLKTKLSDINSNLKVAFEKAGLEYIAPEKQRAVGNPVKRFLDLLAHGQHQLDSLAGHVEGLAANNEPINPADLLALQMKVGHIQQELEFFTALLNKSLESTKTLMNVQV